MAVRSVLITFLESLNIALFFSVSLSLARPFASLPIASTPNSDSSSTSLPASAPFASVPSKRIEPSSPAATSNTKSAVKSCPESASSIKTDLAPENVWVVISKIVRSALPELSTILSVSAESDTLIFSPMENDPVTFCKFANSFAVPVE